MNIIYSSLLFRDTDSFSQRSMTSSNRGEVDLFPVNLLPLVLSWQCCFRRIGHRLSRDFFFKSFFLDPKNALEADPNIVFSFLDYLCEAAGRMDVFNSLDFTFYRSQPCRTS